MQRQDRADFVVVPAGTTELSLQAVDAVRRVPDASVAAFGSVAIDVASGTGAYIGTWDAQAVNPSALTAARKAQSGRRVTVPAGRRLPDHRRAHGAG